MALLIGEKWKSRGGNIGHTSTEEYSAWVWGDIIRDNAGDPYTIYQFSLQHFAVVSPIGNSFDNLRTEPHESCPGRWLVTGVYKSPTASRPTNDAAFSFSTGGGSQKITCSKKTVSAYANSSITGNVASTNDYGGMINVEKTNGKNVAKGVDRYVSRFDFKITAYVAPADMTESFVQELQSLSTNVNSDIVNINIDGVQITFQPGELLFLHCDGSKRHGVQDWELSLNFSSAANQTNLTLGGITGINKRGFDYVWLDYNQINVNNANKIGTIAVAAYVEQIYDYSPLSGIIPVGEFNTAQPWNVLPGGFSGTGYQTNV